MKIPLSLILAVALVAHAENKFGNAVECHFDKTYLLIASTDLRAFLELRSYEKDRVLDSLVLSSRYMPPNFEIKDLVADDGPEFIVQTRDGGSGFAETHMTIYIIAGEHIRKAGDFVIGRQ